MTRQKQKMVLEYIAQNEGRCLVGDHGVQCKGCALKSFCWATVVNYDLSVSSRLSVMLDRRRCEATQLLAQEEIDKMLKRKI
jgi:hypothetical protein